MSNGHVSHSAGSPDPVVPSPESIAAPEFIEPARPCRAYYLGSGEIAVPALEALEANGDIEIVGRGTQPDRPQGRHRSRLQPTDVGRWCAEHDKPVDKPDNVNSKDFLQRLRALQLDVIIVFSFGQILSKALLSLPRLGCLNIHASLLPRHRGASPINAAILAGDEVSGITFMRCVRQLDAGPTFSSHLLALSDQETAPSLERRLALLAAAKVSSVVRDVHLGRLQAVDQDPRLVTYSGKLSKADAWIDWSGSALQVERSVRAYLGWPGARTWVSTPRGRKQLILTSATAESESSADATPGTIVQADAHGLRIACGAGVLVVQNVIPEGKKEMTSSDYLRGCPLQEGSVLKHETTDL